MIKVGLMRKILCFILLIAMSFCFVTEVSASTYGKPFVQETEEKLTFKAVSYNSIKLCWNIKTKASGYRVESYVNEKWVKLADINSGGVNSYTVTELEPASDYTFRLKYWVKKNGRSYYYNYGEKVSGKTTLPSITGFSAAAGSNSIRLSWNVCSDGDGYELERYNGKKWVLVKCFKNSDWKNISVVKLKTNTEYRFRIRAYKSLKGKKIYSGYSAVICKTGKTNKITIQGPNTVYAGESFDYSYVVRGNVNPIVKWSVTGTAGKIDANGKFTATKKGKVIIKAVDSKGKVSDTLTVYCIKSASDVTHITTVNGVPIANKTYPLPKNYDPGALTKETQAAFKALRLAAKKEGLDLFAISGYRSYETQVNTYNYWKTAYREQADSFSARPGFSEHQLGLAIDVNDMWPEFADTAEGKWLAENCYKYGFILRYPSYETEISTGYEYEPWHIRYLGTELAVKVHTSGLTLEEYLGIDSRYR